MGADRELFRVYHDPAGDSIMLYAAYFESQNQGREVVSYQTAALHAHAVQQNLAPPPSDAADGRHHPDGDVFVNATEVGKQDSVLHVLFWYDVGGQIVADPNRARWILLWNRLRHGENPGALFLLFAESDRRTGVVQNGASMEDFARRLFSENPRLSLTTPQ